MRNPLLVPDLRELIQAGETAALRDFFGDHHPAHIAEIIEDLETGEGDTILAPAPDAAPRRGAQLPRRRAPGPDRRGRWPRPTPPRCST